MTVEHWPHWALEARWRVGRKVGRIIYVQFNDEPDDVDQLIGMMDTRELAEEAVAGHNARLATGGVVDHETAPRLSEGGCHG